MTPCDGNFTEHKYLGDKLTVDLKKDEIRAFVAKLAVRSESCPEEYNGQINKINKMTKAANTGIDTDHANANADADENEKEGQYKDQQNENENDNDNSGRSRSRSSSDDSNDSNRKEKKGNKSERYGGATSVFLEPLDLLHPDSWIDFLPLLLDFLTIDIDEATKGMRLTDDYADDAREVVIDSNLYKLVNQTEYLMLRFNNWASRTDDFVAKLDDEQRAAVIQSIYSYYRQQPWKLKLEKSDAKGSLVEVMAEIWTTTDSSKYVVDISNKQIKYVMCRESYRS